MAACAIPTAIDNPSLLAILSANIEGLATARGKHKLGVLRELAVNENVGIITLTESHINENFHDGELVMTGFSIFRADRALGTRKGGVISYVRNDILEGISLMVSGSLGNIEYMVLNIPALKFVYICIYRPPAAELGDFSQIMQNIRRELEKSADSMPDIVLTGDLNFPIICWDDASINGGTGSTRRQASLLLDFFDDYFMIQYVNKPTRGENILDIFATNDPDLVSAVLTENTSLSDHRLVLIKTTLTGVVTKTNEDFFDTVLSSLNFWSEETDWVSMKMALGQIEWDKLFADKNPDKIYEIFLTVITDVASKHAARKNKRNFSLIPRDRRVLMRKRNKLSKKLKSEINLREAEQIERALVDLEKSLIASHRAEIIRREQEAVSKIKENPKYFFKYARLKSKVVSPVGPLSSNGRNYSDPTEMCNILQKQFESVYCTPMDTANVEELISECGPRCLEDIEFDEEDIRDSVMKISPTASAGPDGLPALLLRECIEELKYPLMLFWRTSLDVGYLPKSLKISRVIPIFKGGDRCAPENYRPISLTSHVSKIIERIIVEKIVNLLDTLKLFNQNQHGFRRGRSCLSQLIEHQQQILSLLENGLQADVVYLDFAKAFDKVDYGILLRKLKVIGISGQLLRWLHSFLTDRRQTVFVSGYSSSEAPVISGVPQGSSLGPILFLNHIADIDANLDHVSVSSFADDTRLVMGVENSVDCILMQEDLFKIYQWAEDNNMLFNGKKFELLRYGCVNDSNAQVYYAPDGTPIKQVDTVKDLGVMMSSRGNFDCEIEHISSKGRNQAGWVMRAFQTREMRPMMTLYKAMVLPHLEYCCQLWSPQSLGNIRKLEAVQRSYTARIREVRHLDYWERLRALSLYSLERRRERYFMLYTFKIVNGYVSNIEHDKFNVVVFESERRGRLCRVPSLNPQAPSRIKSLIDISFAVQGPRLFNCLPMEMRNFSGSIDSFKVRLDKFLNKIPDQPCTPNYHQPSQSNSVVHQLAQLRTGGIYLCV